MLFSYKVENTGSISILFYFERNFPFQGIINKWIVFTTGLMILFISRFVGESSPSMYTYILPGLFVILLLWFLDLNGYDTKNVNKDKVGVKPQKKSVKIVYEKKRK